MICLSTGNIAVAMLPRQIPSRSIDDLDLIDQTSMVSSEEHSQSHLLMANAQETKHARTQMLDTK